MLAAGYAHAQYANLADALQKIPELSMLRDKAKGNPLLGKSFKYTVFAPTNAALQKVTDLIGMNPFDMASDDKQVEEFLLHTVALGRWLSSSLTDGQTIKTLSGDKITVSYKGDGAQKTLYLNGKEVTKADITAGDTVVYLMAAPILPQEYEEMLASLTSTDSKDDAPLILESAKTTAPDVVAPVIAEGEGEPDFHITSIMDPVGQGVQMLGGYGGLTPTDDLMHHGDDSMGYYGGYGSGGSWSSGGGSWGGNGGTGQGGNGGGSWSGGNGGNSGSGSSSGGSGGNVKPVKPDQGTKPGDKGGAAAGGGATAGGGAAAGGGAVTGGAGGGKGTGVVMEPGTPSTTPAGAAGTPAGNQTRAEIDARSSAGSFAVSLALLFVPVLLALVM